MSATLVRRWFEEVWNERRAETIDELFAADGVGRGLPGEPRGPEGFRRFHASFLELFPDLQIVVDDVIEAPVDPEGVVRCAARFTVRGTHAPTGRPGTFEAMTITYWRDGQVVDAWNVVDFFGLQQQLGCAPF